MVKNQARVFMIIASASFAVSGVAVHALGQEGHQGWDVALLARAVFGLPFALIAFFAKGTWGKWRDPRVLFRSLTAVGALAALYFALQRIIPGNAFTLMSLRPLWVAAIYLMLGRTRVRWVFWPIAATAAAGVWLMEGSAITTGYWIVELAVLIGIVGALSTIAIDLCKSEEPYFMALHLNVTMLVVAAVLVFLNSDSAGIESWGAPRPVALFLIAGLGGTSYQVFNFKSVRIVGAEVGSAIPLVAAVFAWGLGHLIWQEPSTLLGILGLLLALLPCAWMVFAGGFDRKHPKSAVTTSGG